MVRENTEELLREAFLDPVRTVLMVDDEFPTYGQLATTRRQAAGTETVEEAYGSNDGEDVVLQNAGGAELEPSDVIGEDEAQLDAEAENAELKAADVADGDGAQVGRRDPNLASLRAASLWEAFHRQGWNCDVDDGSNLDPTHRRFGEADLLILDYELSQGEPEPALKLLRALANAPHASLAVVYTKANDLRQVRLQVAGRLWACRPQPTDEPYLQAITQIRDELDNADLTVDDEVALLFLRRGKFMETDFAKGTVKICQGKTRVKAGDIVRGEIERYLTDKFHAEDVDGNWRQPFIIDLSNASDGPLWIWCNNLFVSFVSKQKLGDGDKNEGDRVIGELLRAINDWNPDGLTTTLTFARGVIARGGFRAAADALARRELHAALLYFANAGAPDERSDRVKEFYRRLLSAFAEDVLDEVAKFGAVALPVPSGGEFGQGSDALVKWAIQATHIDKVKNVDLFHELNMFLATDTLRSHADLGTLFMTSEGEHPEYWICVTPGCDMVPRQPSTDRWEGKIDPLRPVVCMRGTRLGQILAPLTQAERGKTVFFMIPEPGGKLNRGAIEFIRDLPPVLEHFYLVDRGRLDESQCIQAFRLTKDAQGFPELQKSVLKVLTQVREIHANRFLRIAGEHVSRIAVDFVDFAPITEEATQHQMIQELLGRVVALAERLGDKVLVDKLKAIREAPVQPQQDDAA